MDAKPSWTQGPSSALSTSIDVEALRERLQKMSDEELIVFGKQMRNLVYPLRYRFNGQPVVSAFSIQLDEARTEWRQRHPKVNPTEAVG